MTAERLIKSIPIGQLIMFTLISFLAYEIYSCGLFVIVNIVPLDAVENISKNSCVLEFRVKVSCKMYNGSNLSLKVRDIYVYVCTRVICDRKLNLYLHI